MFHKQLLAALTASCAIITSESLAAPANGVQMQQKPTVNFNQKSTLTTPDKSAVQAPKESMLNTQSREQTAPDLSVPIADRDAAIYNQDDHLHYTPDKAFALFDRLDTNSDRRLTFQELKRSNLKFNKDEFLKIDTDGDELVDREEFVGIGPDLSNDY